MATKTSRVHNTIHWFRKGLRLHDNQSLMEACETSVTLRPVFFIDPDYVKHGNMGFNRWRFLIESLNDINDSLEKIGSRWEQLTVQWYVWDKELFVSSQAVPFLYYLSRSH